MNQLCSASTVRLSFWSEFVDTDKEATFRRVELPADLTLMRGVLVLSMTLLLAFIISDYGNFGLASPFGRLLTLRIGGAVFFGGLFWWLNESRPIAVIDRTLALGA